jgi:multiple sugar transport system permease protein
MTITQKLNKEKTAGYIFISPFIIGFLAFTIIPIAISLGLAFTNYDVLSTPKFIGLENFKTMFFNDPKFWKTMGVTFYYALVSVPLRLIFALFVAVILVKPSKASGIYRAVYYLPSIMGSSVAVAVLWKRLFSSDGAINALLQVVGIPCDIAWLSRTDTAIWTLIVLAVWQFGSSMLIFLSGLKQIPVSYYEAATIDGAGRAKQFFSITLPMLTPVIFFNLIMQMINGFMAFTQCFIITEGKPLDSTLFYSVYMYQCSFKFNQMGYGCALAWVMLVVMAIMTAILFKTSSKWVFYESK